MPVPAPIDPIELENLKKKSSKNIKPIYARDGEQYIKSTVLYITSESKYAYVDEECKIPVSKEDLINLYFRGVLLKLANEDSVFVYRPYALVYSETSEVACVVFDATTKEGVSNPATAYSGEFALS